jgi:two-component system sensor histidine kinase ResE
MGVIMQEALKLSGLLENLLAFADAQQGLLVLQMESADPGEWLRRYCEERLPGANSRLREFAWSIEPDLPRVRFDEKRLAQVVDALVDNAIKFTPEGSRVEVRGARLTNEDGAWVAIEVADDGPGIPAERIPSLFEAFRQADGSSTRTVGGMGIGLSFSRQLVNAMGGRILVESAPGEGATFSVLLPVG